MIIIQRGNPLLAKWNDASQRNEVIHLASQEIEAFVGILLLRGYNSRPRQRLHWSKDDDISCPLLSRSMLRKRFEDVKKLIYFADNNNLPTGDKLAKIRPFCLSVLANEPIKQIDASHALIVLVEAERLNTTDLFLFTLAVAFYHFGWLYVAEI